MGPPWLSDVVESASSSSSLSDAVGTICESVSAMESRRINKSGGLRQSLA